METDHQKIKRCSFVFDTHKYTDAARGTLDDGCTDPYLCNVNVLCLYYFTIVVYHPKTISIFHFPESTPNLYHQF